MMSDDMCRATTQTGSGVVATCCLRAGHADQHDDGSYYWPNTGEPCTSTLHGGISNTLLNCQRLAGHDGSHANHSNGQTTWPNVQPLQERNRCEAVTAVEEGCHVQCQEPIGHPAPHRNGTWTWPFAERRAVSEREQQWAQRLDDAGGNRDELILRLFDRIEQLEQGKYADGPVTDDRFAAQARKHTHLAQSVGELSGRVRGLEKAQVYGPHDLSALQASINTQFERLNGAICTINGDAQQRNQAMVDRLSAMWDVLAAMAPVIDRLGQVYSREIIVKIGDDLVQTERASGSPAAIRCPERFREGQCLGYAGHDGECSAVPGSGNEQLCEPEEFTEPTYDRSSDGTPLEEF